MSTEPSREAVECPFCDYAGPSDVLFDWGDTYAIEPIDPVALGHVLIIPKAHVANFATNAEVTAKTMQRAAEWELVEQSDCNLITSKGGAATQTVKHLHVHVVPRHKGDGLALPWSPSRQRWEQEVRERLIEVRTELCFCGPAGSENPEICENCETLDYLGGQFFKEAEPVKEGGDGH